MIKNIDKEKAVKAHKSFTVWMAGLYALISGFIMTHPNLVPMIVSDLVSPKWVDMVKEFVIYFISAGGFGAVYYGRVRKSKDLKDR